MEKLTDQQVDSASLLFCECLTILYIDWMLKTQGDDSSFLELKDTMKQMVEIYMNGLHSVYADHMEGLKRNDK